VFLLKEKIVTSTSTILTHLLQLGPGRINTGKMAPGEARLHPGMVFSDGKFYGNLNVSNILEKRIIKKDL